MIQQTVQPAKARRRSSRARRSSGERAPDPPRPVTGPVSAGMYDLDCSEFVSYVLREATPEHYARIPKGAHQACPRAFEYCDYFGRSRTTKRTGGDGVTRSTTRSCTSPPRAGGG